MEIRTLPNGGVLTLPTQVFSLTAAVMLAKQNIDLTAEEKRKTLVTQGNDMQMLYTLKYDEALAYRTAGYPAGMTAYPLMNGEATGRGRTATNTADDVITAHESWLTDLGTIEGLRIGAKDALDSAIDQDAIDVIADSYQTTITAL